MYYLHFKWGVKFYHSLHKKKTGRLIVLNKRFKGSIDSTSNLQYSWGGKNRSRNFLTLRKRKKTYPLVIFSIKMLIPLQYFINSEKKNLCMHVKRSCPQ